MTIQLFHDSRQVEIKTQISKQNYYLSLYYVETKGNSMVASFMNVIIIVYNHKVK